MCYQITHRKHNEVDRYRYQRNHRISQKVKSRKRRVDQEHRIHIIGRFWGSKGVKNSVAVIANCPHHNNGNDNIRFEFISIPFCGKTINSCKIALEKVVIPIKKEASM